MTINRSFAGWTSAVAAVLWTTSAQAALISVSFDGFANGYESGRIYGVRDVGVRAGQFKFNVLEDGGAYWDEILLAFCIDVEKNLVTSNVQYDLMGASPTLNTQQLSLLGQLYDQRAGLLGIRTNDAAFQLAIWEIIYDHGGALNLDSDGAFWSGNFTSNAHDLAQSWLGGLTVVDSYQSRYEFFALTPYSPEKNQMLLVARKIPEPATLALLGAGLLALGLASRRLRIIVRRR